MASMKPEDQKKKIREIRRHHEKLSNGGEKAKRSQSPDRQDTVKASTRHLHEKERCGEYREDSIKFPKDWTGTKISRDTLVELKEANEVDPYIDLSAE